MDALALKRLNRTTSLSASGELTVNAGRYSRAAVIMAFELNGGIEAFAEWAEENKSEFYTKLFGKLIGREAETTKSEEVEDLLDILDIECEDITDLEPTPSDERQAVEDILEPSDLDLRMTRAARAYADAEPLD